MKEKMQKCFENSKELFPLHKNSLPSQGSVLTLRAGPGLWAQRGEVKTLLTTRPCWDLTMLMGLS